MQSYFEPFGISGSQWSVLRVLYHAEADDESALRLTDLGDRLLVRPPSVTGVANRLQRLGLVRMTVATDDLRAKYIRLTNKGRALAGRVSAGLPAQTATLFDGISKPEKVQLHQLLDRVILRMETLAEGLDDNNGSASENP